MRIFVRAVGLGFGLSILSTVPGLAQDMRLLPSLPELRIDGGIQHRDGKILLEEFTGSVGEIPIAGDLTADLAQAKPRLDGRLTVERLDYARVRQVIDTVASTEERQQAEGLIPDVTLPFSLFDRLNFDLDLDIPEVTSLPVPFTSLSTRASLENGRLALKPFDVTFAQGTIRGESALNARTSTPSADLMVEFEGIDVRELFEGTRFVEEMSGRINGSLSLLGTGNTLNALLAGVDGEGSIAMNEGTMSGLILEGAGVDLVEALALYVNEDDTIPLSCGRLDFVVQDGLLEITRMIVDTEDSVLVGGGTVDLGKETIDLGIETRAKDFSLIDASTPILIEGSFSSPSLSLGEVDSLPFFELGGAEPVDCERLLQSDIRRNVQTDPEDQNNEDE